MTSKCACPARLDQLLMIEYPGFVRNVDKALDSMGGLETIAAVKESQKDRLELKFRKLDPLSHPAYGDRIPKKCLVLNIKKVVDSDGKCNFKLTIVGKIDTSFRFETLAEFQWLPMQRTNLVERIKSSDLKDGVVIQRTPESLDPKYNLVLDEVLPIKNSFDNTLRNFNPDAPLLILPAVFSRFDTPREIHQPHPKFRSKEMRDEFDRQQNLQIIGRTRKKRTTRSYLINYEEAVPDKPPQKLIEERSTLSAHEKDLIPKLMHCFERQKVWSKSALCYALGCSTLDIKYILPLVAFHYLNGPFRTMWVKYGYNPHTDCSSKVLQAMDFRVKNQQDQTEYSRRCIHQYQLPMRKNAEKARSQKQVDLKSIITGTRQQPFDGSMDDLVSGNKGVLITEAMCKFRRDLVPTARQLSYQLKDIEIQEIQDIIHNNDGKEPAECSEKDGWLPEGTIDKIRKIMTNILKETVDLMSSQLVEGNIIEITL